MRKKKDAQKTRKKKNSSATNARKYKVTTRFCSVVGAEKPYCAALQDDPPVYYSYANTRDSPSRSRLTEKKENVIVCMLYKVS